MNYFVKSRRMARKMSNFLRIPLTFKNWALVMRSCLSIYITHKALLPVVVSLRKGPKLEVRRSNMYDIGSIIETYQRMVYFPHFLQLGHTPTIIDVGASIGDFSIYCATCFAGSRILSFEPSEEAHAVLKKNILLNNLQNSIRSYSLAVSGTATDNSISLEEILKTNRIERCDLLKMDCEGAEYDILLNTSREDLRRIMAISMECHIFDNGEMLGRLENYLRKSEFIVTTTRKSVNNVYYLYATR